jgi:hypothetical protein
MRTHSFAFLLIALELFVRSINAGWCAHFRFSVPSSKECAAHLQNRLSVRAQVERLGSGKVMGSLSREQFLFIANSEVIAKVDPVVTESDMMQEKSMYSATPDFARAFGGPIVRKIIDGIPSWYYDKASSLGLYPNIDVRVHDLRRLGVPEGFDIYPAIPGWHADGEFRETYFAQPDLNRVPVSFHVIATVSTHESGVSNTEFLKTPVSMRVDEVLPDSALWQNVHRFVESMDQKVTAYMRDGDVTIFDSRSLHRATRTARDGWRLFFRMSMWHKPNLGEGQVSKQEQLYLLPARPQLTLVTPTDRVAIHPSAVVGTFRPTDSIETLAQEQSLIGASLDALQTYGGPTSKRLIENIPQELLSAARSRQFEPVVDSVTFRLYPGYRPYFPDPNGNPVSTSWHRTPGSLGTEEVWMSVSTHPDGMNQTEFADIALKDGQVLLASASTPRRELPATNRGWRLMMRVRFVPRINVPARPIIINRQYVDPSSEDKGW